MKNLVYSLLILFISTCGFGQKGQKIGVNNNGVYIITENIDNIKNEWKQLNNQYPFDCFFLDEQLNRFYKTDIRLMRILSIFAVLAIVIACMGLFGLSIYTAKQRTKWSTRALGEFPTRAPRQQAGESAAPLLPAQRKLT